MKKILTIIGAIVFVVLVGVWLILSSPDHIEDTNGPEDFSLQTITDRILSTVASAPSADPRFPGEPSWAIRLQV